MEVSSNNFCQTSAGSPEQIVRFHSGVWNSAQCNYSPIQIEILSIVLCISKFQDDLLNKKNLVRVDCKSAKHDKKMFKTLHQNKFLHVGKPYYRLSILILNTLKAAKIASQIS